MLNYTDAGGAAGGVRAVWDISVLYCAGAGARADLSPQVTDLIPDSAVRCRYWRRACDGAFRCSAARARVPRRTPAARPQESKLPKPSFPFQVALLAACVRRGIPVLCCAGAGAKADPSRLRFCDVSESTADPLARSVRHKLRQQHGIDSGVQVSGTYAVDSVEVRTFL